MTIVQWGLILNIAGSLIICFWGLPSNYFAEQGGNRLATGSSAKGVRSNNRIKGMAFLGIFLLVLGFVLEFIDTLGKH